jgi:hypothetical protein
MSLVFVLTLVILAAAVVLIEIRAVRAGDELRHHAPGFALVMGGLILISLGIAAALSDAGAPSLLVSTAGLVVVAFGATRHRGAMAHQH